MNQQSPQEIKNSGVALVSFLTILLTGLNGLITYIFLMSLSRVNYGRDPEIKHGLASGISRLGGVAIICSVIFGVIFNLYFFDILSINALITQLDSIVCFSILIGLIGLLEDLFRSFSSVIRLVMMLLLVFLSLLIMPELIPYELGIFNINSLVFNPILIFLITLIMICGYINAGNIADGANGLLASIYLVFFIILYSLDNSIFNFSILMSLIVFIIYNVSTGRIFLGDFGSYSLSALVAFKSLELYANHNISVFFLASILVYPSFEITRSLVVRFINKSSLMSPDNYHLHNYMYNFLLSFGFKKHITNSFTGLIIAVLTSGPPLLLFFSDIIFDWLCLFLIEISVLSIIYIYFTKKYSR
tara:strand:+ start:212 stop:1291 length:1080 start_codon:yes stop_codon:yes gene_type:complete